MIDGTAYGGIGHQLYRRLNSVEDAEEDMNHISRLSDMSIICRRIILKFRMATIAKTLSHVQEVQPSVEVECQKFVPRPLIGLPPVAHSADLDSCQEHCHVLIFEFPEASLESSRCQRQKTRQRLRSLRQQRNV